MAYGNHPRFWTDEETQTLRDNYLTLPMPEIAKLLGKSASCVSQKASLMGMQGVVQHATRNTGDFSATALARKLSVSNSTLRNWSNKGCPHRVVGARKHHVYRWAEVMAWLRTQPFIFAVLPSHVRLAMGVDFDEIPVSPYEAHHRLGIPNTTLWGWAERGCPTVNIGRRTRCYVVRDVMRWILDNPQYGQNMPARLVREWRERLSLRGAA